MAVEFTCCECSRSIVLITSETRPEPPLCATCLMMPGWLREPLRDVLDPGHEARDPTEQLGSLT